MTSQWLALMRHCKKVLGSILSLDLGTLCAVLCWVLSALLVLTWVFSGYSNQKCAQYIAFIASLHELMPFFHLGEVVAVAQAELWDVDGNRINNGEAAVLMLLWAHHGVTALWWLWEDIAGCRETGNAADSLWWLMK